MIPYDLCFHAAWSWGQSKQTYNHVLAWRRRRPKSGKELSSTVFLPNLTFSIGMLPNRCLHIHGYVHIPRPPLTSIIFLWNNKFRAGPIFERSSVLVSLSYFYTTVLIRSLFARNKSKLLTDLPSISICPERPVRLPGLASSSSF